jgi:hypothetical protein
MDLLLAWGICAGSAIVGCITVVRLLNKPVVPHPLSVATQPLYWRQALETADKAWENCPVVNERIALAHDVSRAIVAAERRLREIREEGE